MIPKVGGEVATASPAPSTNGFLGSQLQQNATPQSEIQMLQSQIQMAQSNSDTKFSAPPAPPAQPAMTSMQQNQIDYLNKSLAEVNKRNELLEQDQKRLEAIKNQSKNASTVLSSLQMQVQQWREKVTAMESSVNKYNMELRSLDDQRGQINTTIAKVAELSLKCGMLEKECVRNERENAEWKERMNKAAGLERVIKALQDQIEDWKEKCQSLETSCFMYQQEQQSANQLESMLANGENQLRVVQDAQRSMYVEVADLEAKNKELRKLAQHSDPNSGGY